MGVGGRILLTQEMRPDATHDHPGQGRFLLGEAGILRPGLGQEHARHLEERDLRHPI